MAEGDDTYDLAEPPPQPVLPATPAPAPSLAYASVATPKPAAKPVVEKEFSPFFPDKRRDFIWPLAIAVIGIGLLFFPAVRARDGEAVIATSCYLFVKYVLMFLICLSLAMVLRFSFGTFASAAVKILAIVAATDGWMFACFEFDHACAGLLFGLIGSIMICATCIWKLLDLEADEIAITTALYWCPSLVFSWLIFKATAWLMAWVL
jgi:hypothetical protein